MQQLTTSTSLGSKLWRRVRDLPAYVAEIRYLIAPDKFAELHSMAQPYAMCSRARLRRLFHAVRHVVENNISGDIVECGVAFGGSAALMGLTLKSLGVNRKVWAFDTFDGMPPPTAADPDYDSALYFEGAFRSDLSDVKELFERFGIAENAVFVKGLFHDTVPKSDVRKIAVLHLDGDWYESVKVCLDHLYDRVVSGGIIQIDDYGHWAGARKAVDDFFDARGISVNLRYVDYSARQIVKP